MFDMRTKIRIAVTVAVIAELFVLNHIITSDKSSPASPEIAQEIPEPEPEPVDFAKNCKVQPPEGFSDLIREVSAEYSLDPKILAVTVYRESGCDQWALGSSGEIGLAQVLPKVWFEELKEAGIVQRPQELWDPRNNLRASAWILSSLHKKADGNLFSMFRRYNGQGAKARKYAAEQKQALIKLF